MADLSRLSDADLVALKAGDLSRVSDDGLMTLRGVQERTPLPAQPLAQPQILANGPATMNPAIAAQGVKIRENMTPPESVTDPRYPAYAQAQRGSDVMDVISGLGGGVAGGILKPGASAAQGMAKMLMRSAIKPSSVEDTEKVRRAITTALETRNGGLSGLNMEDIRGRGRDLNQQVDAVIAQSPATVPSANIPQSAAGVLDKARYENRVDDVAAGSNMLRRFMDGDAMQNADIPLAQAQAVKQGVYKTLGDTGYGLGLKPAGERDVLKSLASGLRRDIESRAPGVVPLNAEAGDLWNLHNIAGRSVASAANKNPLGLNLGVAVNNPAAAAAFALERSQIAKAIMARLLNNYGVRAPGAIGGAAVGYNMGGDQR